MSRTGHGSGGTVIEGKRGKQKEVFELMETEIKVGSGRGGLHGGQEWGEKRIEGKTAT